MGARGGAREYANSQTRGYCALWAEHWSACADNVRRAPPGAACASIIFFLNKHFFTKKINYKPQAEAATAPPSIPSAAAAAAVVDRHPPAADRRPPTADRRPPTAPSQAGQAHLQADVTDLDAEGVLTVVAKRSKGARSMRLTISLPFVRACCESGRTSASDEPRDLIGQHPTRTILVTM